MSLGTVYLSRENKEQEYFYASLQVPYESWELENALEELVKNKLNSMQRMEVAYGRINQSKILDTVMQSDMERLHATLAKIDENVFDLAVETILNAR